MKLRLPADRPIRGRVIDPQGKPVAGAKVRVNALWVYGADTVEPFLAELLKRPNFRSPGAIWTKAMWGGTRLFTATTDKDGRFEFAGAGAERRVSLWITGPGIAQTHAEVITRTGFDPEPYNAATRALRPKPGQQLPGTYQATMLLGPDPTVVAEAEKPIRGVVSEAGTGKPRPGVRVSMGQDNGTQRNWVEATTDKDGRYEIRGAFKAPKYDLTVRSDPSTGMVQRSVTVPDSRGYEPVVADIQTARGVVITGQVTDATTGKPLPGRIWIAPLFDNSYAEKAEYSSFSGYPEEDTGPDGRFRVVTIPGRVLLMVGPDYTQLPGGFLAGLRYRQPTADPQFPDYFRFIGGGLTYRTKGGLGVIQGSYCKVLDIKPGATEVRVNVALERVPAMTLSLRDRTGRPVAGTWMHGLNAALTSALWYEAADVEVYGVEKDKPRVVTFFEPKNKLIASVTLKGDEKQPVVVTLGPPGVLKGRLLNSDGTPEAGVTVSALYPDHGTWEVFKQAQEPDGCVVTDKNGVFRFDRMIPGHKFSLMYSQPSRQGRFRTPTQFFADRRQFGPVKAGETTDLGDLTLQAAASGSEQ